MYANKLHASFCEKLNRKLNYTKSVNKKGLKTEICIKNILPSHSFAIPKINVNVQNWPLYIFV